MLGSSMSASFPNTVLNAIMAESLNEIADQLEGIKYLQDIREKALDICRGIVHDHKKILFSGDGYSDEWVEEAARRGLPCVRSFIESVEVLSDPEVIRLFTSLDIYDENELYANRAILEDRYEKMMTIEVRTMLEMARRDILPAMTAELNFYAQSMNACSSAAPKFIKDRVKTLSGMIDRTDKACDALEKGLQKAIEKAPDTFTAGKNIYYSVSPLMAKLRAEIDAYEDIAGREFYHLPMYEDMLFNL